MKPVMLVFGALTWIAAPAAAQGPADPHAGHAMEAQQTTAPSSAARNQNLPPDADAAPAQLKASPRHSEWVDIKNGTGPAIKSFVVRSGRAHV